jgi:RNA polymerase sigma-70 factor (ECF subfamily)
LTVKRDKAARFLALLEPWRGPLESYVRRMLRDRDAAEDVLQSALAEAYADFDRFQEGTNFKAWIFRYATLQAFNRNRKHEPTPSGDELASDLSAEESWGLVANEGVLAALLERPEVVFDHFDDAIVRALAALAPLERATLLLRSLGDFSYREIHDLLAIPVGSVIGYLSRARSRMRLALAEFAAARGLYRNHAQREGISP